jgi:hypothetical protein
MSLSEQQIRKKLKSDRVDAGKIELRVMDIPFIQDSKT